LDVVGVDVAATGIDEDGRRSVALRVDDLRPGATGARRQLERHEVQVGNGRSIDRAHTRVLADVADVGRARRTDVGGIGDGAPPEPAGPPSPWYQTTSSRPPPPATNHGKMSDVEVVAVTTLLSGLTW